jgi:hypothetical protein
MLMIPSQPHNTQSRAELRVFDQLRRAFTSGGKTSWFAMHSLNLPRHEYKRFGEIDFVVCGPGGVFVLEVKGGSVSCHDGIWQTTNRHGETDRLKESPFKQAEGALHGLRKKLPASVLDSFVVGYGVIVPDCNWPSGRAAEWDRETLADARDFREFERWLERLIRHWHNKDGKPDASADALRTLRQVLRPDFDAAKPLHAHVNDVEERIARLTDDQLRLVDIVDANPRVLCTGGAGTGKTMLAIELAKRWTAQGKNVALVCHSPWLKGFLERSRVSGLAVGLADSIGTTLRRTGIDKFDALIVDEGQDLLNMSCLDKLDVALMGGIDKGQWCFFHDVNNQSGLCGEYSPDAYDYLMSFHPAQVPLRTNCRNSLQILEKVQQTLNADMGTSSVGQGPVVVELKVDGQRDVPNLLARELRRLIENEGCSPGEIMILSPAPFNMSGASRLPADLQWKVIPLDEFAPRYASRTTIGFAEVANFKGLESEVVVLIDMPPPSPSCVLRALQYVGMSRARSLLYVISVESNQ